MPDGYAYGGKDYETIFAYYRHISGATLNLASHPIKVSTEGDGSEEKGGKNEEKKRKRKERRSESKSSTDRKRKMEKKSARSRDQGVLSTFPHEAPVRVINENLRRSAFLGFALPCMHCAASTFDD